MNTLFNKETKESLFIEKRVLLNDQTRYFICSGNFFDTERTCLVVDRDNSACVSTVRENDYINDVICSSSIFETGNPPRGWEWC